MAKSKAANNIWAIELGNEPDRKPLDSRMNKTLPADFRAQYFINTGSTLLLKPLGTRHRKGPMQMNGHRTLRTIGRVLFPSLPAVDMPFLSR